MRGVLQQLRSWLMAAWQLYSEITDSNDPENELLFRRASRMLWANRCSPRCVLSWSGADVRTKRCRCAPKRFQRQLMEIFGSSLCELLNLRRACRWKEIRFAETTDWFWLS